MTMEHDEHCERDHSTQNSSGSHEATGILIENYLSPSIHSKQYKLLSLYLITQNLGA
jgi:hypothetical protein